MTSGSCPLQESVVFCVPLPDSEQARQAGLHLPRLQPHLSQEMPREGRKCLLKFNNQLNGIVSCTILYLPILTFWARSEVLRRTQQNRLLCFAESLKKSSLGTVFYAANSVTRLGDFLKFFGCKSSSKSSQNVQ